MTRTIEHSRPIPVDLPTLWKLWTTVEGVTTFFAPAAKIELRPGGAYEMYFMPEQPAGLRGSEGCVILALQPNEMFSFTWNAPPHFPEIRQQRTHVSLRFEQAGPNQSRLTLQHDGWGTSPEWQAVFQYFERVWNEVVLERLIYSIEKGPINWAKPPIP